jgi:hypothetical protein
MNAKQMGLHPNFPVSPYPKAGRYVIAVKVVDIFGNDTMTLVPVTAG